MPFTIGSSSPAPFTIGSMDAKPPAIGSNAPQSSTDDDDSPAEDEPSRDAGSVYTPTSVYRSTFSVYPDSADEDDVTEHER